MCFAYWLAVLPLLLTGSAPGTPDPSVPDAYPSLRTPDRPYDPRRPVLPAMPAPAGPALNRDGWTLQGSVSPPDDGYVDGGHFLTMDPEGRPWVIWYRKPRGVGREVAYWSRWQDAGWLPPQVVSPDDPSWIHKPRMMFQLDGTAWAVWNRHDGSEIWYTRLSGETWDAPRPVHAPDAFDYYSPEIASGGGEVWITWYGKGGANDYDVFVARWGGEAWEPFENITADHPGWHWFCDIAVDSRGTPHLVWGGGGHIYYSRKPGGESWTSPETVDPPTTPAAGWPMCHIEVDDEDQVHVVWVGRRLGKDGVLEDQDVFYSRLDGNTWATFLVNAEDGDQAYYPEFAVQDKHDVWIAWHDEGASWTEAAGVFVTHFDGTETGGELRLDTGDFHWNQVPRVAVDAQGEPWVAWSAIRQDFTESAILFSRRPEGEGVPVLLSDLEYQVNAQGVALSWWADPAAFVEMSVERSAGGSYSAVGPGLVVPADGRARWMDPGVPAGDYRYRIAAWTRSGAVSLLGPVSVRVGAIPFGLELRAAGTVSGAGWDLEIGAAEGGALTLQLLAADGRVVGAERSIPVIAGWQRIVTPGWDTPNGVYWVHGSLGDHRATAKVIRVP